MEAIYRKPGAMLDYLAVAAISAGQVIEVPDGRAAVATRDIAAAALGSVQVDGIADVTKAADVVILKGAPIWWDHSANAATPVPQFADRDFYLGCAQEAAVATASMFLVDLNQVPHYIIDALGGGINCGGGDTVVVLTAGTPSLVNRGGMMEAAFSATAEAQKLDWLSKRSFPKASNWILEAVVNVATTCDADVGDLTIGVANGTHASDFQSVTEFVTFHFDLGADLNIDAQSDDGTTDVAPTDTTIDFAEGTPVHLVIDGTDETDCQMYVNGVLVLGSTVFTLAAAASALKAIFHLEKSSNDSPGNVQLLALRVRIMEQ